MTPIATSTPSIMPNPTYQELTALGICYSQLTPNAPVKFKAIVWGVVVVGDFGVLIVWSIFPKLTKR